VQTARELQTYPRVGASWEGFVLEQVATRLAARPGECFFWATHTGAELDLLIVRGQRRLGFEIKHTSEPRVTPSMRVALEDLKLERLDVVHAGSETYPLSERVRAVSARRILEDLRPL
jgi:predicted AAA+ superfamily ATPase